MDRKITLATLAALSLSACNNIEESTDSVADSLEQQNEILQDQNALLQQQIDASNQESVDAITLVGELELLGQDSPVESATVKYKLGTEWSDAIAIENGVYQIPDVPGNSDIKLLFESPQGTFASKEVSGHTNWANGGGSYQHIYSTVVTESVHSFEVVNADTLEAINDLVFSGSYHQSGSFNQFSFEYSSTFNLETGKYEITLPDNLQIEDLVANLDVDDDGEKDYQTSSWYDTYLLVGLDDILNEEVKMLTEYEVVTESPTPLTVRVSVINSQLNHLANASIVADDESEGETEPTSTFNTETQQHDITISILDHVRLNLPAFEENELHYGSNTIDITKSDEGTYYVRNYTGYSYRTYESQPDNGAIDLVVQLSGSSTTENIPDVVALSRSSEVYAPEYIYKSFYSGPLELVDGGIELVREDQIVVTRGNENADDFVLPGTTTLSFEDQTVDIVTNLSLNNTLLSIEPAVELDDGATYQYRITGLKDKNKDLEFSPNHLLRFTSSQSSGNSTFDINDLVLDNSNYTTNGSTIITENSANVATTSTDYSTNTYLYFPASVLSLKNLLIKVVNVVDDGSSEIKSSTYNIIEDGQVQYLERRYVLAAAANESVQSTFSSWRYVRGTTLSEGYHWRIGSTIDYLSDDTDSNTNNASFEYIYETQDGEIHSGTITLSVQ